VAQPRDESELVTPAVEGTRRVLRAAADAGIDRVVLTSSYVAMTGCPLPPGRPTYDGGDWTRLDDPSTDAYARSKTLAERAAWAFVADEAPSMALTVVHPGFVLGPPLDDRVGASVSVVRRLLRGRDPMLPRVGVPVVDVRDVADAHLRALRRPDVSTGRRYLLAGGSRWLTELAATLRAGHPGRRIATRTAPDVAVRLLGRVDRTIRASVARLGTNPALDTRPARADLGLAFRSPEEAVLATAEHLLARGLV
jgi:dihydroflavonol-4-reductase